MKLRDLQETYLRKKVIDAAEPEIFWILHLKKPWTLNFP